MREIETEEDIQLLVDSFYDKVKEDAVLGPVFNTIIGADWSHHLPVIYRFWSTVLLGGPGYSGNVVGRHIEIDRKMPLSEIHYQQWLQLWSETLDRLFTGEKAAEAKKRAGLMMQLISFKIDAARNGKNFIQ
jgi:hemoglobin